MISQHEYTYDDRGFITGEDVVESLYGYAWDDKHDKLLMATGKENRLQKCR